MGRDIDRGEQVTRQNATPGIAQGHLLDAVEGLDTAGDCGLRSLDRDGLGVEALELAEDAGQSRRGGHGCSMESGGRRRVEGRGFS